MLTNKDCHGKNGCLVAIVEGTKPVEVIEAISKIPIKQRGNVRIITRDMAETMSQISTACFPNAIQVDDRFHVQKMVSEALQEIRIDLRKQVIKIHNEKVTEARKRKGHYWAPRFKNGDSAKELLARSRYLLYKASGKWSKSQKVRADILFQEFPQLKIAYNLTMHFRGIYEHAENKRDGLRRLQKWYAAVTKKLEDFPSFETPLQSIQLSENTISNYFTSRHTNASAESFNAKIKGFRSIQRGVTDVCFFLYRLSVLYG